MHSLILYKGIVGMSNHDIGDIGNDIFSIRYFKTRHHLRYSLIEHLLIYLHTAAGINIGKLSLSIWCAFHSCPKQISCHEIVGFHFDSTILLLLLSLFISLHFILFHFISFYLFCFISFCFVLFYFILFHLCIYSIYYFFFRVMGWLANTT